MRDEGCGPRDSCSCSKNQAGWPIGEVGWIAHCTLQISNCKLLACFGQSCSLGGIGLRRRARGIRWNEERSLVRATGKKEPARQGEAGCRVLLGGLESVLAGREDQT